MQKIKNNLTEDNNHNLNSVTNYKDKKILQIPLEIITPNPYQPRLVFSDDKLSALASSISQYGVLQPIVVSEKNTENGGKGFEIVAGERRYRASKIAGLKSIPAVITSNDIADSSKFELAIIENLQREDLNPVDKAKAFRKLHEQFSLTHSQIADKMGKSREYVSNSIRILELPDLFLDAIINNQISEGHSKPLLILKDRPFEQNILFEKIKEKKLTVRASDVLAKKLLSGEKEVVQEKNNSSKFKIIEKKLSEKLGTKVSINKKEQGQGGKLTIEFFSHEDLDKIVNLVRGKGLDDINNVVNGKSEIKKIDESEKNNLNNFSINEDEKIWEEKNSNINFFEDEINQINDVFKNNDHDKDNKISDHSEKVEGNIDGLFNLQNEKMDDESNFNNNIKKNNLEKEEILDRIKINEKNINNEQYEEKISGVDENGLDGFNISSFLNKEASVNIIEENKKNRNDVIENSQQVENNIGHIDINILEENKEEKKEFSDIKIDNFGLDNVDYKKEKSFNTPREDFKINKQEIVNENISVNSVDPFKLKDEKIENQFNILNKQKNIQKQVDQQESDNNYNKVENNTKADNFTQAQDKNIKKNSSLYDKETNEFAQGDLLLKEDKLDNLIEDKINNEVFGKSKNDIARINDIIKTSVENNNNEIFEDKILNNQKQNNDFNSNTKDNSIYQEFLRSKKNVIEEKEYSFSNSPYDNSGIDNINKDDISDLSSEKVSDENSIYSKANLNNQNENIPVLEKEQVDKINELNSDLVLVNNGSDFLPDKGNESKVINSSEKNINLSKLNNNQNNRNNLNANNNLNNFSL